MLSFLDALMTFRAMACFLLMTSTVYAIIHGYTGQLPALRMSFVHYLLALAAAVAWVLGLDLPRP
jgi:hypothetical protein